MSGPEESRPQQRLAWLLLIGQRLKREYDAIAKPLPAPLALLLQRLDAGTTQVDLVGTARQDIGLPPATNRGGTAGTPDDGR
jgi:hypothetical protein